MANFNNQFATQKLRQEMSVTGTGATFTPGTGEQTAPRATKKVVKKKLTPEEKDVEPKLAAGKAKVYMKDKWGWKDAPSVPNRPSKGGFIYKQLFEELSSSLKTNSQELARVEGLLAKARETKDYSVMTAYENRIKLLQLLVYIEKKLGKQLPVISLGENFAKYLKIKLGYTGDIKVNKIGAVTNLKDIADSIINSQTVDEDMDPDYEPEEQDDNEDSYDWFTDKYKPVSDYGEYRKDANYYEKDYNDKGTSDYFQRRSLDESYSKFKTETKTRGKSDQFHQAVREVRRKVQEINRLFEYVSRLKTELSEGEGGLKYKMHTEKALAKIKEMVSELNQNIKKFK
jgi:hypothetical protein